MGTLYRDYQKGCSTRFRLHGTNFHQEIYYCEKYGVSQSLFFKGADITPEKYINSLLGRISFALQIDPADVKMHEYFKVAKKLKSEVCGEK